MANSKKKGTDGAIMAAEIGGAALAAVGAAAAGFYYFGSEKAATHRRKTTKWANDMKDRVVKEAKKEMKKVPNLDKAAIATIVDRASKAYEGVRNVKREDLVQAASELKQNWKEIQAELAKAGKKGSSAVKKAVNTSTKSATKTVKKAVKKAPTKKTAKKVVKKAVKKVTKK
jgi:uncharacterized membrane protein YfbV (UPF0208 family)